MKTQIEIIDHAMTMLQAFKDGKKLMFEFTDCCPAKVESFEHLLDRISRGYEITIAPEPKKLWRVVNANGGSVIFIDEEEAKAACEKWDGRHSILSPYTLEHYVQVMP